MTRNSIYQLFIWAACGIGFASAKPDGQTVKVFILAGQSNMEGHAVVDLEGKDYNGGKGTLATLMRDPSKAAMFKHLKTADGKWTVRDDVQMWYQREDQPLLAGPLALGFSVYGDVHHFGPELQFGHVIGDALENPVLIIKTAWGGKSLFKDFRPPSSGGEVGKYYQLMIAQVREVLSNMERTFPAMKGRKCEIAGSADARISTFKLSQKCLGHPIRHQQFGILASPAPEADQRPVGFLDHSHNLLARISQLSHLPCEEIAGGHTSDDVSQELNVIDPLSPVQCFLCVLQAAAAVSPP